MSIVKQIKLHYHPSEPRCNEYRTEVAGDTTFHNQRRQITESGTQIPF